MSAGYRVVDQWLRYYAGGSLLWYLKKALTLLVIRLPWVESIEQGANENIYKNDECYLARRAPRVLFIYPFNRKEKCAMDYGLIGKIEKAKQYVEERERIHLNNLRSLSKEIICPHR